MRKLIAAMNITIDGFCDHTEGIADDELHQHYAELLKSAGAILYGRKTYQLMEYWRTVLEKPSENQSENEFAAIIDKVPKIVFSRTLKSLDWKSARIAQHDLKDEILELKKQPGKDVFVGSPSLIAAAAELQLIDEFQLCVHPVIAGKGLRLFGEKNRAMLKLIKTRKMSAGQIVLYYVPAKNI
jgi:dihydrofolate reductase